MKIHDSLRQECMPEMVYAICKLVNSKKYTKEDIKTLITLGNPKTTEFNKVFKFATDCDFIFENADGSISTHFSKKELESFKAFRYRIFKEIYQGENTLFIELSKWFLSLENEVFSYVSDEWAVNIPSAISDNITEEYILGFRFWLAALGVSMLQKKGTGRTMVFNTNQCLEEWIITDKPFPKGKSVLCKDFFNTLLEKCPLFEYCIDNNSVNLALSMGLRVLHINKVIELKYTTDSGDIWHLSSSVAYPNTNNITEIIVR